MKWTLQAQAYLAVTSGGRSLAMNIVQAGPLEWITIAIETAVNVEGKSAVETLREISTQHAHETLKPQRTLSLAMREAEHYARWWQQSGASHEVCDCPPIENSEPTNA